MAHLAIVLPACGPQPGPSIERQVDLRPHETTWQRQLDASQRQEVIGAMRSIADGPPAAPASTLERQVRWSDLPDAIVLAAEHPSISMAVVRSRTVDGGSLEVELLTFDDLPVRLRIDPQPGPEVYLATAEVGFLPELHRDRARQFVDELRRTMRRFGRKLGFSEQTANVSR